MFYVYVLKSRLNEHIYIGSTKDLKHRFAEHNKGSIISTKRYKPWMLLYYEAYSEEKLARMREKRLKLHGNAIKELKKRIGMALPSTTFPVKAGAGFTLIELLVVIGILGILAAGILLLLNPFGQIQKSRDARRKSDLSQLQKTLEAYYSDNGRFPYGSGSTGAVSGCSDTPPDYHIATAVSSGCMNWGSAWSAYSTTLPTDPKWPSIKPVYWVSTDGQSYALYTSLEKALGDPQACIPATGAACSGLSGRSISSTSCGGVTCNYGVTSPNISP